MNCRQCRGKLLGGFSPGTYGIEYIKVIVPCSVEDPDPQDPHVFGPNRIRIH
jgi:hypothetical protein